MTEISNEYAEALFTLAYENGMVSEYAKKLSELDTAISENPEYTALISSPAIPLSEKLTLIDSAFADSMPEYIVSFLKLLCENKRFEILHEAIEDFHSIVRMSENRTSAKVYCAEQLSDQQKAALVDKLSKILGKKVDAEYILDDSLIGGVKIVADGRVIDGSVKSRLNKLKGVIGK